MEHSKGTSYHVPEGSLLKFVANCSSPVNQPYLGPSFLTLTDGQKSNQGKKILKNRKSC